MTEVTHKKSLPKWADFITSTTDYVFEELGGGERKWVLAHIINIHKIITLFIVLGMMFYFDNFSVYAWVYLGLHGIYGYCWLVKDFGFRDPGFTGKITTTGAIMLYVSLVGWYWLLPYFFISSHAAPSGFVMFSAVAIHTLGITLMIAADCQKHFQLKYKKGLINNGVFAYTRNPNFLGEIMIYGAYALLANHIIGYIVFAYACTFFYARMLRKDHSISRYPGWDEYAERSSILIPWKIFTGK